MSGNMSPSNSNRLVQDNNDSIDDNVNEISNKKPQIEASSSLRNIVYPIEPSNLHPSIPKEEMYRSITQ